MYSYSTFQNQCYKVIMHTTNRYRKKIKSLILNVDAGTAGRFLEESGHEVKSLKSNQ